MGAPELPTDPGDDDLHSPTQQIQHAPMPSDDSDNDSVDAYDGYQPLSMMDNAENSMDVDDLNEDSRAASNVIGDDTVVHGDHPNLPNVESVNVEITRQVWGEPRPRELQIELDSSRTEQILSLMANVSLPNASVPDWARGVPEERWKDELLERIRQRNEI